MSQDPTYPPGSPQPVYPGGPAPFDWRKAYGYPPGGPALRPGILTAVGVMSIVVAGISLLGSGLFALGGLGMFQMARMTTAFSTSSASAYSAAVQGMAAKPVKEVAPAAGVEPPAAVPEPTGRGMGQTDRETVLAALASVEPMTNGQQRQLDAILARQGLDFFPGDGADATANLTRADVTAAIKAHGTVPSPDPGDEDPVYFNTVLGHLELHDDRAIFRFSDPSEPAVRTSAGTEQATLSPPATPSTVPSTGSGEAPSAGSGQAPTTAPVASDDPFAPPPAAADPFANPGAPSTLPTTAPVVIAPAGTALAPAQIAAVVQKVQAASGNKMTPVQLAAVATALAKPDQQFVTSSTLWSPVSVAMMQPDGSVILKMNGGYLIIDSQGQVSDQMPTGMPKVRLDPMPIALVVAESVASLAAAVFLLVSGIFLLKESPRGRRLHQIFALIKIPLAVIAVTGFSWMMSDLASNMRRFPGSSAPSEGFVTFGTVLSAAGLIYPIVLLIIMHTKTVRDYYRTMTTSIWDV
jgi:hypothetical protein